MKNHTNRCTVLLNGYCSCYPETKEWRDAIEALEQTNRILTERLGRKSRVFQSKTYYIGVVTGVVVMILTEPLVDWIVRVVG